MKLFLIKQNKNNDYDTYDSAVVAAPDADAARLIHPTGDNSDFDARWSGSWVKLENIADVEVEYLGEAKKGTEQGVICASFNAG